MVAFVNFRNSSTAQFFIFNFIMFYLCDDAEFLLQYTIFFLLLYLFKLSLHFQVFPCIIFSNNLWIRHFSFMNVYWERERMKLLLHIFLNQSSRQFVLIKAISLVFCNHAYCWDCVSFFIFSYAYMLNYFIIIIIIIIMMLQIHLQ